MLRAFVLDRSELPGRVTALIPCIYVLEQASRYSLAWDGLSPFTNKSFSCQILSEARSPSPQGAKRGIEYGGSPPTVHSRTRSSTCSLQYRYPATTVIHGPLAASELLTVVPFGHIVLPQQHGWWRVAVVAYVVVSCSRRFPSCYNQTNPHTGSYIM